MTFNFSKHFRASGDFLTVALYNDKQHLGWLFLSLIIIPTAPPVIKNQSDLDMLPGRMAKLTIRSYSQIKNLKVGLGTTGQILVSSTPIYFLYFF